MYMLLRQKRNISFIKDFLLLCKDRKDPLLEMRNVLENKMELTT